MQIKKQLQIALVRFKVVNNCAAWVIPTRLQVRTTAAVLASVFVPRECLTS
jgi:hypothetical protein